MNTVYPATAYIKGFLNTLDIPSFQVDLSLEVLLKIFTSKSLRYIFDILEQNETELSDNSFRIFTQRERYIHTIDIVISFLQDKNHAASISICGGNFLPKASRFDFVEDLDWAFGTMGTHDKAKHLATLYLEEICLLRQLMKTLDSVDMRKVLDERPHTLTVYFKKSLKKTAILWLP